MAATDTQNQLHRNQAFLLVNVSIMVNKKMNETFRGYPNGRESTNKCQLVRSKAELKEFHLN